MDYLESSEAYNLRRSKELKKILELCHKLEDIKTRLLNVEDIEVLAEVISILLKVG